MTRFGILVLASTLLFAGCTSYYSAVYGVDTRNEASSAWTQCHKDNLGFGWIPDFGITVREHFSKCMREAGWEQIPGSQYDGYHLGPIAYRRIQS
jgi:hypothetical protein